jgi:hypothetical protein
MSYATQTHDSSTSWDEKMKTMTKLINNRTEKDDTIFFQGMLYILNTNKLILPKCFFEHCYSMNSYCPSTMKEIMELQVYFSTQNFNVILQSFQENSQMHFDLSLLDNTTRLKYFEYLLNKFENLEKLEEFGFSKEYVDSHIFDFPLNKNFVHFIRSDRIILENNIEKIVDIIKYYFSIKCPLVKNIDSLTFLMNFMQKYENNINTTHAHTHTHTHTWKNYCLFASIINDDIEKIAYWNGIIPFSKKEILRFLFFSKENIKLSESFKYLEQFFVEDDLVDFINTWNFVEWFDPKTNPDKIYFLTKFIKTNNTTNKIINHIKTDLELTIKYCQLFPILQESFDETTLLSVLSNKTNHYVYLLKKNPNILDIFIGLIEKYDLSKYFEQNNTNDILTTKNILQPKNKSHIEYTLKNIHFSNNLPLSKSFFGKYPQFKYLFQFDERQENFKLVC